MKVAFNKILTKRCQTQYQILGYGENGFFKSFVLFRKKISLYVTMYVSIL